MRRITRRELLAAGAIAPALVSCGGSGLRRSRNASTVTVLYEGEPETVFGPVEDEPAKLLVFMPLVAWNRSGELEGRLAESWEHSRDFRTWTIHLRDGIRWHDGMPVTAHDMKFTLDLMQQPETEQFAPGSYSVAVLDLGTYRITYHRQDLGNEGALSDSVVCWPKHLIEKLDPKQIAQWDFWSHPIGCGPYRHVRTVSKTMIELEANPDYYRGRPKIETVILKFSGFQPASAMPELLSGNVDAAVVWDRRRDVTSARRDPRLNVFQQHGTGFAAFWWNGRHELFQDAAVRRALTLAINRRELIQFSDLPEDTPVTDFLFTKRQYESRDFLEPLPYDPQTADQLLDAAGWPARNRKGLRVRGGKTFRFTMLVMGAGNSGDAAVYVQDELKRVGIRMDISYNTEMEARLKAGDFEAAHIWFGAGADLQQNLRSRCAYHDPSFFELLERTQTTFNPEEKDRGYQQLARIFQTSVPVTLLFPSNSSTITNGRLRGLDNSPYRGDLTQCMDELWMEEV